MTDNEYVENEFAIEEALEKYKSACEEYDIDFKQQILDKLINMGIEIDL